MYSHGRVPLPSGSETSWARHEAIAEFWNQLRISDDVGMTTWEDLAPLERQVTECILGGDFAKAESLTAEAMHLIVGHQKES